MKLKRWDVSVLGNRPVHQRKNTDFYTSDTDAYLKIKLTDRQLSPQTGTVTLFNKDDKSLVSESVDVVDNEINYHMRGEVVEHGGNWQVQLVYMQVKNGVEEKYTSPVISFSVTGHLLDQRTPVLVAVENWTKFVNDAEELFAEWVALEETLESNENERIANEQTRQENYNELVETGMMQENINQKLAEAEQEYAPKLTEVTAQLDQTNQRFNQAVGAVTEDSEVVMARGDKDTLGERLDELEKSKANKKQEDWIFPTMLNGWLDRINSGHERVAFMKDELGFVHLAGHTADGSDDLIFTLPEGYRPSVNQLFVVPNGYVLSTATTTVRIDRSGDVVVNGAFRPSIQGISFKVVD